MQIPTDINVIKKWDKQAENLLANGAKVLWFPDAKTYKNVTVEDYSRQITGITGCLSPSANG